MKSFFAAYGLAGVAGSILLLIFRSEPAAIAFLIGCSIMMLNVLALRFAWGRILQKKQVALSMSVIVIKYAVLGFIIYSATIGNVPELQWFAAGFALVPVGAIGWIFHPA